MKKNKHGGYRKGSGAKPKPEHLKKEPTKVMRIPKAKSKLIKLLLRDKDLWDRFDKMRDEEGKLKTIHPMP